MTEVLVRGVDVTRVYRSGAAEVTGVRDATFLIPAGNRVALVGPSGSGKTTLLHLLAGLDRPTSGTIEWPALGRPEGLRPGPVSIAFQGPSLLPPLTVAENVALPVLLAGGTEAEAQILADRMIALFALSDVAAKLPEELSGGQAQRAALARALTGDPRLVLADEPTGQQDRATGLRVLDSLLARADETGAAVVVATHDPSVADRFRVRWSMEDGRLRTAVPV